MEEKKTTDNFEANLTEIVTCGNFGDLNMRSAHPMQKRPTCTRRSGNKSIEQIHMRHTAHPNFNAPRNWSKTNLIGSQHSSKNEDYVGYVEDRKCKTAKFSMRSAGQHKNSNDAKLSNIQPHDPTTQLRRSYDAATTQPRRSYDAAATQLTTQPRRTTTQLRR